MIFVLEDTRWETFSYFLNKKELEILQELNTWEVGFPAKRKNRFAKIFFFATNFASFSHFVRSRKKYCENFVKK